ncbi:MAG: class I SAM-dependent methyltransferase [bacterium]|nr:class I SAM-dependent methyltransferase [bacterium]
MEEKKIYEALYNGEYKGDSWTLPENFIENPRARAVYDVREKFMRPVSVLDIGCGKGVNTKWIAESNDGSTWTGIDIVSKDKIGLDVPNDAHHGFFEGDILNEEFRKQTGLDKARFDIIVDQGSVFVEMDDLVEVEKYLKLIHSLLSDKGVFLALTIIGKPHTVIFADGRRRVIRALEDFQKPPFSNYFDVETELRNIDAMGPYTIEAKLRSGENVRLQIAQISLTKIRNQ